MAEKQTGISAVLSILDCFSIDRPELGLTELCTATGYPKANMIRYLNSLLKAGLVKKNNQTKKYTIGYKVYELFHIANSGMSLRKEALPFMKQCNNETSETVVLFVENSLEGSVCIERVDTSEIVRYLPPIGVNNPYHAGASSKTLLAHMPAEKKKLIITRGLNKVGANTVTDPVVLNQQLEDIRQSGYAISVGENNTGVRGIAVPIWGKDEVIASLCIGGPEFRFTEEKARSFLPLLKKTATNISKALNLVKE